MSKLPRLRPSITLPKQKAIRVKLTYYDASERVKLMRYPTHGELDKLASQIVEIPMEEFLTYFLFHRRRLNPKVYANFAAVRGEIQSAAATLEHAVEFSDDSIRIPEAVETPLNAISEHVGEAIGLSIASRIHNVIEADWKPIPQQYGLSAKPTFDFLLASDGEKFVELETKGSSVVDNTIKSPEVYNHASNIRTKKKKIGTTLTTPIPRRLRYGTITAIDRRAKGTAHCWILDPSPEALEANPRAFRLVQRLYHMRNWIGLVAPRSQLAAALSTRTADVERIEDPFELDRLPLLRGDSEEFYYDEVDGESAFLLLDRRFESLQVVE